VFLGRFGLDSGGNKVQTNQFSFWILKENSKFKPNQADKE